MYKYEKGSVEISVTKGGVKWRILTMTSLPILFMYRIYTSDLF